MTTIDEKKLEKLLSQGKLKEAGKIVDEALKAQPTALEKGAIYTNFALLYMRVMNQINQQYLDTLNDSMAVLQTLDQKMEQKGQETVLNLVRKKIQGS